MIDTLNKSLRVHAPFELDQLDLEKLSRKVLETKPDKHLRAIYLSEDHQDYTHCLEGLDTSSISLDHCNSIPWLLRSGHYQSYSLFILPADSPLVSSEDLFSLLDLRLDHPFRLIDGITKTEELETVFKDACEAIYLDLSIETVARNYLSKTVKDSPVIRFPSNPQNRPISDDDFKHALMFKLREHLNSPPEDILKEAINTIRKEP